MAMPGKKEIHQDDTICCAPSAIMAPHSGAGDLMSGKRQKIVPGKPDASRVGGVDPAQAIEDGGFSCTVWTDQPDNFRFRYSECNIVERDDPPEDNSDVCNGKNIASHTSALPGDFLRLNVDGALLVLFALPHRLSLLEKGSRAFVQVFAREEDGAHRVQVFQRLVEAHIRGNLHRFDAEPQRQRAV